MNKQQRHKPKDRKALILRAGLVLARKSIYSELTRKEVAEAADVAPTLVTHYFGTVEDLRRDIMLEAIREEDETIVAQGLARGDKQARKAPEALKNKAAKKLASR